MIEITKNYFRKNIKLSILTVFLLSILFLIINISVDDFKKNMVEKEYIDSLDDSIAICPWKKKHLDMEVAAGRADGKKIGYVKEYIVENDKTGQSNVCFAASEFYMKHFVFPFEGRIPDYQNGKKEVLLYGDKFKNMYHAGETIFLEGTAYTMVGYIPSWQPIYDFSSSSSDYMKTELLNNTEDAVSQLESVMGYPFNGGMYIVNDSGNWENTGQLVLGFAVENKNLEDEKIISMKDVKIFLNKAISLRSRFHTAYFILLTCMGIFVLLSLTVIQHIRCGTWFGVLRLCGMNSLKYYFMGIFIWCFQVLCAFIVNIFITFFQHYEERTMEVYATRIQILGSICGISMAVLSLFQIILSKKAVLEVLKNELS